MHEPTPKLFRTTFFALAMATTLTLLTPGPTAAGDRIEVRVVSGRVFNAEVADRPIAWQRVASAELDGHSWTGEELRRRLLDGPASTESSPEEEQPTVEPLPAPETPSEVDSGRTMAEEARDVLFAHPPHAPLPRLASVHFDAHIANWDADVEADGLAVQVIPLDAAGGILPVKGHLEAELHTRREIAFDEAPRKRGRRIDRIGRWSAQVLPHQVRAGGVWLKLPFQADHPEFDTDLGASGLVHVKLVVPGQGVYESSLDGIRLRPFAPLRDDLQRVGGRRFLAHERTGRGQRAD